MAQDLIVPITRVLIALAAILGLAAAAAVGFAAAADAGLLRGTLVRLIAARVGRPIEVAGRLEAHLLTRNPRITAEHVTVGNPPWVAPGHLAEIGEASLLVTWPGLRRPSGLTSMTLHSATFYLMRNASGHANWQWTNPDAHASTPDMAIVRSVSIDDAHVLLDDELRHLVFQGNVSAEGGPGRDTPLEIHGNGQLNGREASFEIAGDALAGASHELPYHFSFTVRSAHARLSGRGSLPHPFDFDLIDTAFEASGPDLKDLYFLAGVSLIHTGGFRLSGNLERRGNLSKFHDLAIATGQSDARGTMSIDTSRGRPQLDVDLSTQTLRMADLGENAARGHAGEEASPWMLSDAALSPAALRLGEAHWTYHAAHVDGGRMALDQVEAKGSLDHGVLTVSSFLAGIFQGKLEARLTLDARPDPPAVHADLKIENLQLADIHRQSPGTPPLEGPLDAHIEIAGRGSSMHQVAASGSGTMSVAVPRGTIRESFAELTGIDLRGFGLLLAKDQRGTPLRCALGSFSAQDGVLTAQKLVVDTEPVLIPGEGRLDLKSEELDFVLRGHPKSPRFFRLHGAVQVKGTLLKPAFGIEAKRLEIIDPGRAQDEDCAALLAAPAS